MNTMVRTSTPSQRRKCALHEEILCHLECYWKCPCLIHLPEGTHCTVVFCHTLLLNQDYPVTTPLFLSFFFFTSANFPCDYILRSILGVCSVEGLIIIFQLYCKKWMKVMIPVLSEAQCFGASRSCYYSRNIAYYSLEFFFIILFQILCGYLILFWQVTAK